MNYLSSLFISTLLALFSSPLYASQNSMVESCGWLVEQDGALVQQPDPLLKPSDLAPLPLPPPKAKAAYCKRDTLEYSDGDFRLIELGLPFVLKSGDRESVLELSPSVLFDYYPEGDKYLPSNAQD